MTGPFMKKLIHPILIAAGCFLLAIFISNDNGTRAIAVGLIWTLLTLTELLERP